MLYSNQNKLETSWFNAIPSGYKSQILNELLRIRIREQIVRYLISAEKGLKINLSKIIEKFSTLDTSRNFSPALYAYQFHLIQSIKSGSVQATIDAINQLYFLSDRDIYDIEFRIESILTETWENGFIDEIRKSEVIDREGNKIKIYPLLCFDLENYRNMIHEGFKIIQELESDLYDELTTYVTRMKLFRGQVIVGVTAPNVFGAIYLNIPRGHEIHIGYFLEHLIHEVSHLHLNTLLIHDAIVLNDSKEKYTAPIRWDPRPMFGIFHATFVLSRMVRFYRKLVQVRKDQFFAKQLKLFEKQFLNGSSTVKSYGKLTDLGQKILDSEIVAIAV